MKRFTTKNALLGAALAGLAAAPASADLNYYWALSDIGLGSPSGTIANDLSIITDNGGFTAVLLAELTQGTFYNPNASNVPPASASADSYFGGGFNTGNSATTPSPILVGKAVDLGGDPLAEGISATLINETWIPDFDQLTASSTPFPTGTVNAPAFGGRFSASSDAMGTYQIRLNNENGDLVEVLTGTITNGRFSQRLLGDSDMDNDVDTVDITNVISNFTGAGGAGPIISVLQGNHDGDTDIDTVDITATISNFTGAGGTRVLNNGVPELIYDASTGGVSIDAEGQTIVSFSLQSDGRFLTNFDATQLDFDVFNGALPGLTDNTASVIGWTSGGAAGGAGYSGVGSDPAFLGVILEAGLTEAELAALLTDTGWAAPAGGDSGAFELTVVNIPEPGSLALFGLGGLALLRRRR